MKCFPWFEREPEGNSEMVSLCNDQNLDTQNHLCDHNQKVKKKRKKKTYIIMRKGQPLKLQPCMLTDSKWMRVFNSIVSNITMIPNSGNRSKFGVDILNKQDRKALASSNEREAVKIWARQLKFYPMKLYTDTKARWRKVSQQFSAILSTSSCTHMRQKQPNFTQSKCSFYKQSLILLTSLWWSV